MGVRRKHRTGPCGVRAKCNSPVDVPLPIVPPFPMVPPLFHYTTAAGLLGILESGEIRATHLLYTNDTAEMEYGVELLKTVVKKEARGLPRAERGLLVELAPLAVAQADKMNAYAFCLSEEPDLLSQWRAYAGNGAGYSLGFNPEALRALVAVEPPGSVHLVKVEYEPAKQRKRLEQVLRPILAAYKQRHPASPWAETEQTTERALVEVWQAVVALKHPAFAEEREWRLVVRHDSTRGARFRTNRQGIVPYAALRSPTGRLPLTNIVIGPAYDGVSQGRALRGLLDRFGMVAHIKHDKGMQVADELQKRTPTVTIEKSNATFHPSRGG